jgi:hypothetical protein
MENPHILNPLLAKECCSLCLHGRSDRSWPMNNLADWRKGLQCRRGINGRKFVSPTPTPPPPLGPPMCYHYRCTRDSLPAFRLKISAAKMLKKKELFMRYFFLACPAAFFIPTVWGAYRIDTHQCRTLHHGQKSKPIDFPRNDVNSTSSGPLDQDLRNPICQTWLPNVVTTILISVLEIRPGAHTDM